MSPSWFLVGVVLCYFQVVDGAVQYGGFQQADDNDDSQYYCPAEWVLPLQNPGPDEVPCTQDFDCNKLGKINKAHYMCCAAIILDGTYPPTRQNTINRCVLAETKSTRGYCPQLLVWLGTLLPFNRECNYDHDCAHDEVCCYSGFQKSKFCMTAQTNPPTKFHYETCPDISTGWSGWTGHDNPEITKACVTDYGCPYVQICCSLECRDAKSVG